MVRVVMAAWRDDRGGGVGSYIGVHIVPVIVVVMQVTMHMVGTRLPPRVGVAVVMGGRV